MLIQITPRKNAPVTRVFVSDTDLAYLLNEVFAETPDDELPTTPDALRFELSEWLYDYLRSHVTPRLIDVDWALIAILYTLMPDEVEALFEEAFNNMRYSFCETIEKATAPTWNEQEDSWNVRVASFFSSLTLPTWARQQAVAQFSE